MLSDLILIVISICTASWALWQYWHHREPAPKIAFDVDTTIHKHDEENSLADISIKFHNLGKTRVQVSKIGLRVRGIQTSTLLEKWEGRGDRLRFPDKLINEQNVIPEAYSYMFMEPGIEQSYKYVTKIPTGYRFLLVHAEFYYTGGNPHSAEKLIVITQT